MHVTTVLFFSVSHLVLNSDHHAALSHTYERMPQDQAHRKPHRSAIFACCIQETGVSVYRHTDAFTNLRAAHLFEIQAG